MSMALAAETAPARRPGPSHGERGIRVVRCCHSALALREQSRPPAREPGAGPLTSETAPISPGQADSEPPSQPSALASGSGPACRQLLKMSMARSVRFFVNLGSACQWCFMVR